MKEMLEKERERFWRVLGVKEGWKDGLELFLKGLISACIYRQSYSSATIVADGINVLQPQL